MSEILDTIPIALPYSQGAPVVPVAGRIRTMDRRFHNDVDWWSWLGVSDLSGVAWVMNGGREAQLVRRLDAYQQARRTVVRMTGMLAWPGLDSFSPHFRGYWEAMDHTYRLVTDRGMYLELCFFADAQTIVPDTQMRRTWMTQFGDFCRERPCIIPQCANEAFKNGWSDCDDPALLELAEILATRLGHRDFSISDPAGEQGEGGSVVKDKLVMLSHHSNICVIHSDRSQHGDTKRWRRWIDHLEGFTDVMAEMRQGTALVHDEPMGAGPQYVDGRRDNDPDAFVAAQMVSLCCGLGYTYHWIVGEGLDAANLPGIAGELMPAIPITPEWRYYNDSWLGSPTEGITWHGLEGKLRHLVRNNQAWSVAYGDGDWNSVRWRPGWSPRVVHQSQRVSVWAVNQ